MHQMEHFITARLTARDWADTDLDAAFAIYGRDEVMRWLGAEPRRPVASREQMKQMLDRMISRGREEPAYGMWAVELRATGQVVGTILLSPLPGGDGEVEIGWHFNPDHWGAGYATEAGRGVLALAFGLARLDSNPVGPALASRRPRALLDRVLAVVDPGNVKSLAVCQRLGMTHLGQTDQYYGLTLELFELTRGATS
jgi:RimJ/RimL family protein N-acetyltransferase